MSGDGWGPLWTKATGALEASLSPFRGGAGGLGLGPGREGPAGIGETLREAGLSAGLAAEVLGWYEDQLNAAVDRVLAPAFWSLWNPLQPALAKAESQFEAAERPLDGSVAQHLVANPELQDLVTEIVETSIGGLAGSLQKAVALLTEVASALGDRRGGYPRAPSEVAAAWLAGATGRIFGVQVPHFVAGLYVYYSASLSADQEEGSLGGPPVLPVWNLGPASKMAAGVITDIVVAAISDVLATEPYDDPLESDVPLLPSLLAWVQELQVSWLRRVLVPPGLSGSRLDAALQNYSQTGARLHYYAHEAFGSLRTSQLFDMVVGYPASKAALADLRACLTVTHNGPVVAAALSSQVRARLLIPGARTEDILDAYIALIKTLGELDPESVILASVAPPIEAYLSARPDSIRAIVSSLTEDPSSDLFQELIGSGPTPLQSGSALDYDSDGALDADITAAEPPWNPPPRLAADDSSASTARSVRGSGGDIISRLVNIYGSKELFVNEYEKLLASRLLRAADYDVDDEARNIEFLKKRFGDRLLHRADIMIKDMADSKRVNKAISETLPSSPVKAIVVSAEYWPKLPGDDVKFPAPMASALADYGSAYSTNKAPRSLVWRRPVGTVQVELELDGESLGPFSVSPLHAAIIYFFTEADSRPVSALASELGLAAGLLVPRLRYWESVGLLTPDGPSAYRLTRPTERAARSSADSALWQSLYAPDGSGGASGSGHDGDELDDEDEESFGATIMGILQHRGPTAKAPLVKSLAAYGLLDGKPDGFVGRVLDGLVQSGKLVFGLDGYQLRRSRPHSGHQG